MTKKLATMLLAAVLLVSVCAVASATRYYVTGNNVRVRIGPGTDEEIIGHVTRGDTVEVESISGGWAMIVWGSYGDGYISSKYISRNKPGSAQPNNNSSAATSTAIYSDFQNTNYYVIVNPQKTYVNMRWEASKSSPVRRIYYYGAQLRVIAENNTWCQVIDESTGEVGFIMKILLLRI